MLISTTATTPVGANDVNRLRFGFAMPTTYGTPVVSRGRTGFNVVADYGGSCHATGG